MKIVLSILLALSQVPSEADFKKAKETLAATPDDPEANTVAGKYLAFVQGDYDQGMVFLAKSSDKTLRTLAEHERDADHVATPAQKIGMGDEWVTAAKKFSALNLIFLDRATSWYITAWPDLTDIWKEKAREQASKMSVARPQGVARRGLPLKWENSNPTSPTPSPALDNTIARTGSYSIRIPGADPKISTSENGIRTVSIPFAGQDVEYSAFVRTDKTEGKTDQLYISFFDDTEGLVLISAEKISTDLPFWNRVSGKVKAPANATSFRLGMVIRSKKGIGWVDDMSVKVDGKEILKNRSFEER